MAIARQTPKWEWIGTAWKLFVQEATAWCLIGAVFLVATVAYLAAVLVPFLLTLYGQEPGEFSGFPWPAFAAMGLFTILYILISIVIHAGALLAAKEQLRGGKPSVAHILRVGPKIPTLIGLSVVISALALVGLMLCVIPGLIVAFLFYFATPLVVMGDRGITQAMRESYEMVKQDPLMFILFAFVNGIITGIGSNLCYVGLIVSYPLGILITAVAYHGCFEAPPVAIPAPNQPPPFPKSL